MTETSAQIEEKIAKLDAVKDAKRAMMKGQKMPIETVEYRDHLIELIAPGQWQVRESESDDTIYWVGATVGECQAVIDEVLEDMAE